MKTVHMLRWLAVVCSICAASVTLASGSSSDEIACGSAPASWNVPNGAIVFSRFSAGETSAVLSAVGESRTHTMLSHGSIGYATHATAKRPGSQGWPDVCGAPVTPGDIARGYPGPSQINMGGLYAALYLGGQPDYMYYQTSKTIAGGFDQNGAQIANWTWSNFPYQWVTAANSSYGVYRLKGPASGALLNFSLYQYRDIQGVNYGGEGVNNGMVCSTIASHVQYRAGYPAVAAYTYDHTKLVNAGNALYNSVKNECGGSMGFWPSVGSFFFCFDGDLCDEAASQVRNCMAAANCGSSDDGIWNNIANNGSSVAVTISPDRLGGWSGHPWTGPGVSVWAADTNNVVQWNQGGSVYGCWR